MKKVIATLLAAALVVPAAAQAQSANRDNRAPYAQQDRRNDNDRGRPQAAPVRRQQATPVRRPQVQRFNQGQRFDRSRATNYARLNYRQNRQLRAPGRNQVWVRAGNEALLVSLNNNVIQRVVRNAF